MNDRPQIEFFLGANSPSGFYSLYDHLLPPDEANAIYILKGGAGCGKSTLMRTAAGRCEAAGYEVERVLCSGDPGSLDAIVVPALRAAVVDGTAPHVVEPKYPGVVESYVNLGDCYDKAALQAVRGDIVACMAGYKDCYKRAYRCLGAAAEISEDLRAILLTDQLEERMQKRAKGILKRECRRTGREPGRVKQRFLGAVTPEGVICRYGTVEALAERVYELRDSYGLSHLLLSHLLVGFNAAGYDVVACPSPMAPDRVEHLLVPELRLAFVTAAAALPYPGKPDRRLRLDGMADRELLRRSRPRLRFGKKVTAALMEEASQSLAEAKAMHDDLEALYNPHVDFGAVAEAANRVAEEILALPAQ